jgi:hypothetical protein
LTTATATAEIDPKDAGTLRELMDRVVQEHRGRVIVTAKGLRMGAPGAKVVRALLWATYQGSDLVQAAGAALFGEAYAPAALQWPDGVQAETARGLVDWFLGLKLNIPAPGGDL